jgi:hypothetical protein
VNGSDGRFGWSEQAWLQEVADVLGWESAVTTVPRSKAVFGRRNVVVAARLDTEAHTWRVRHGWPPAPSRAMLTTTPSQARLPPNAVVMEGILAPATSWAEAFTTAVVALNTAPCAALLVPADEAEEFRVVEADFHGLGVVTSASGVPTARVAAGRRDDLAELHAGVTARWQAEHVYAALCSLAERERPGDTALRYPDTVLRYRRCRRGA